MLFKSLNIDPEKENRIVNAATKIFAENGYQKASTNDIVKVAEISKGLLFHYFKSKKDLYLSLFHHLTDLLAQEIYNVFDWKERDIFMTIRQVTLIKFELFKKYPEMINFLISVNNEESLVVKEDINQLKEKLTGISFNNLFSDIDLSKFKEGIDVAKAIEVIFWTFEGVATRQQAKTKTMSVDQIAANEVLSEIDSYIELLKNSFYK
ncbi:TetR/AcrR family transcriptional regulator [Peribacillus acanthi]|uniref:TetR/AcrR family transcriptional regulator n=1 Tax=Peribacillus acanthi TaxID=2171554 RepID=UPI001F0BA077|nr:TetR/AcrR family transcriptional regulator [Peribacillus acanthi]